VSIPTDVGPIDSNADDYNNVSLESSPIIKEEMPLHWSAVGLYLKIIAKAYLHFPGIDRNAGDWMVCRSVPYRIGQSPSVPLHMLVHSVSVGYMYV